jgi:hypothetical protein
MASINRIKRMEVKVPLKYLVGGAPQGCLPDGLIRWVALPILSSFS